MIIMQLQTSETTLYDNEYVHSSYSIAESLPILVPVLGLLAIIDLQDRG